MEKREGTLGNPAFKMADKLMRSSQEVMYAVLDPEPDIRGRGGEGPVFPKLFLALRASVWSKNRRGGRSHPGPFTTVIQIWLFYILRSRPHPWQYSTLLYTQLYVVFGHFIQSFVAVACHNFTLMDGSKLQSWKGLFNFQNNVLTNFSQWSLSLAFLFSIPTCARPVRNSMRDICGESGC